MHPDISEFSYGYALTETLVSGTARRLKAAPVFPSLIDEGRTGGYDVQIPFPGAPLFLQFKLSHCMVRDTAIEVQQNVFEPPFYRMHLRPLKHSQQHPMLLDLEATGAAVYYAAPYFHMPAELNEAYVSRKVRHRSIFIRPKEIGNLPDREEHHVAFKRGYPIYICSDQPRMLRKLAEGGDFEGELREAFSQRDRIDRTEQSAEEWAQRLEDIVREHRQSITWISDRDLTGVRGRRPLQRLTYFAQTFFGCNVLVVAPDDETP